MPHFRTFHGPIYDPQPSLDDSIFELFHTFKDTSEDGSDPEPEVSDLFELQNNSEPPSPYEGIVEDLPPGDDGSTEGRGDNVFGFEDLFGIG